jgi:predicted MFS family arabinose efflux permease
LILIATGPGPVIAVAATALLGFGFSFPWSSVAATVLRQTPDRERGSVVGVLSAFVDLFVGASSFSAGLVAKHFGYSAAFLMAAAALGAAAIGGRFVFPAELGDSASTPDESAVKAAVMSTEFLEP